MYYPRFVLTINDDRIAGMTGTFKVTDKRNILQYDIHLTFETKRVQANLSSYVTYSEASVNTQILITYVVSCGKIPSKETFLC